MDASLDPPLYRACRECHRKKTKCDMQRPRCGLCIRTGSICDFPLKRKPPRKSNHLRNQRGKTCGRVSCEQDDRIVNLAILDVSSNHGSSSANSTVFSLQHSHRNRTPTLSNSPDLFTTPDFPLGVCSLDANFDLSPASMGQLIGAQFAPKPFIPPLPASLVNDLTDVFFSRIQPIVPLLHKPDFTESCRQILRGDQLCREDLAADTALLLYAMFALSARFSTHPTLVAIPPLERGDVYGQYARMAYQDARTMSDPTLQYLQGCILLAFHFYSSGLSSQGWILVGVCVRIAYDLDLSTVDDGDSDADWHEKELHRRAWWLVWELDSFGSIMMRKPFGIDRRHRVHLPVCDDDWFSGKQVRSGPVMLEPGKLWRSLLHTENQCERAWYLVANFLFSLVNEQSYKNNGVSSEQILALQNDIACLKLSLPASFQEYNSPNANLSINQQNWIVGTEVMLTVSQFLAAKLALRLRSNDIAFDHSLSGNCPEAMCISRISAILRQWSSECIAAAHPFLACAISPSRKYVGSPAEADIGLSSLSDLAGLVQNIFARHWPLGSIASSLRTLVIKDTPLNKEEYRLAKRYAILFTTLPRQGDNSNDEERPGPQYEGKLDSTTINGQDSRSSFSGMGLGEIFGMHEQNIAFPM